MNTTSVAACPHGAQDQSQTSEATLRLLVRWLLDCHERTRQRGQLGVLSALVQDGICATGAEAFERIGERIGEPVRP